MTYVFDSSSLIDLFKHYYPDRFPSLWKRFDDLVQLERIISVREVLNEIKTKDDRLSAWANERNQLFPEPNDAELGFVREIFRKHDFQSLVRVQERLQGKPVADPFVISSAKFCGGCVVTEEIERPSGSRIPNVCKHFGVKCVDLEQFMKNENWVF